MDDRVKRFFEAQEASHIFMAHIETRAGVFSSTTARWKKGAPRRGDEAISKLEVALVELIKERQIILKNVLKKFEAEINQEK